MPLKPSVRTCMHSLLCFVALLLLSVLCLTMLHMKHVALHSPETNSILNLPCYVSLKVSPLSVFMVVVVVDL